LIRKYDAHHWVYLQTKSDPFRYKRARAADPNVALLYKPEDDYGLEWILAQNDPNLVAIELSPETARPDFIEKAHAAGKLVSQNAWHYTWFEAIFGDGCDGVFARGIDIAITKHAHDCAKVREQFERAADK